MWAWELLTEAISMKHALNNLFKLCLNDKTFDRLPIFKSGLTMRSVKTTYKETYNIWSELIR